MASAWLKLPTLVGILFILAGMVFIGLPNWDRAQIEYQGGLDTHLGADAGLVESVIGITLAVGRAIVVTFAVAVFEHPILTVLFGVGSILVGVVLVVEYGLLASDDEPWHGEFEM